jgi:hypothetical protein
MFARGLSFLRMTYAEMIVPVAIALGAAALLVVLLIAWDPPWAVALLPAAAFIGANFWGWTVSYRRLQALEDAPLSRIASCAQGYARLEGRAAVFPGKPLRAPVSNQPCCWYRYVVSTVDAGGRVDTREVEETDWSFAMNDGSGECIVDPAGARVLPVRTNRYRDKNQAWTEHVILPGDPLCVIGQFTTSSAAISEAEIEFRTGQLLVEWKRDMKSLMQRYPPSHATTYSEREWDEVRKGARREVERAIAHDPPQPQNRIEKPGDDRPFLISAEPRAQLALDLTIWAWLHAFLFVGGVAALAWLYLRYF